MKTYFSDIIPKIQRFSQRLDNLTLLTNQHWVVIDDIDKTKNVFIFRENNELLIAQNGKVEKAKWEYLGNNTLLIDRKEDSYLFKHGFFDENILALKVDSKEEYAFLVNETKYDKEINTSLSVAEFLKSKYLRSNLISSRFQNNLSISVGSSYLETNYNKKKISKTRSLLGPWKEKYLVEFEDGEKGVVLFVPKHGQAFFLEKKGNSKTRLVHYYKNLDYCINGFYYYLKTNQILHEGYITTLP